MPDNHNLDYNYGFHNGTGGNSGSTGRNGRNDSELIYWIITIAAFVACWPVGLFLLFRKLDEGTRGKPQKQVQRQKQRQAQRQTAPQRQAAQTQDRRPKLKAHPGRGFLFSGACTATLFGFCTLMQFLDVFPYAGLFVALQESAPLFFLTGVGAALMMWGNKLNRQNREFRKLLGMVGNRNAVDLEALAGAADVSYDHVAETLQDMIDAKLFGDYAFLDLTAGRLVLNSDGLTQPQERPAKAAEPINLKKEQKPEEPAARDEDLLFQIRAANDAIADPVMSAKIDRIEQITQRILACQKEHPERASQLRSFLNYYLPTTLKILNSYAEMANQGIEGENISAAKKRIEAMMDKVVEGFEKQLDKLYAGDLLDITSDITVMEKMMAKDGLAGSGPFGTAPAPKAPSAPTAAAPSFGGAAFQTAPPPEEEKEIDPADTWR